jgi:hypothetical protein
MCPPRHILPTLWACLAFVTPSSGLQVRSFSPTLHHRLLSFPGAPVYPQIPAPNPQFTHAPAAQFRGIGWPAHATDWTRQMALVSPRHFVYATHYPLGADWQIAFAGSDGLQHTYGIASQTPIINPLGQTTDLMLCELSSEVDSATGVTPFHVLNLSSESAYQNQEMIVFGSFVTAGRMPLAGFTTLVNDPGFDTTRFAYFDYNHNSGGVHDCDYQGGDSGAPAFIMDGGTPALIGIASGRDPQGWGGLPANISRNYIAFIPEYLAQMDGLMATRGFHLRRTHPAATTVSLQTLGTPLRRLMPGTASFRIQNTGPSTAHNLALSLAFAHGPTAVNGSGTICEATAPATWRCRRGGLLEGAATTINATWELVPDVAELQVTSVRFHDGVVAETSPIVIPVIESYASWVQGVADSSQVADPDHDGLSNLIEYALGGASGVASTFSPQGHPLRPTIGRTGNLVEFTYARRTDAAARGLAYQVEISADPAAGWTSVLPPGTISSSAPFMPASDGFEQVTLGMPLNGGRLFVRLHVSLAE